MGQPKKPLTCSKPRCILIFMKNDDVARYGITDVDGFVEKQRLEVARQEIHLRFAEEQLKVLRLKIAAANQLKRAEKILK